MHEPDVGLLQIDGQPHEFAGVRDAIAAGITLISQEGSLLPDLSVAENVFLGRRQVRRPRGIDWRATDEAAVALLDRLDVRLDPRARVRELPVDQQQFVEIARALSFHPRVMLMDEPTSSLDAGEVAALFAVVEQLRGEGVSMVFVSHRLGEMLRVSDRVTVLRDGSLIASAPVGDVDEDWLVRRMVGRPPAGRTHRATPSRAGPAPALEVDGLSDRAGRLEPASFRVGEGEIVGVAGLVGAGRTELLETIFGLRARRSGQVRVRGRAVTGDPLAAKRAGLALVPDDRKGKAAVLGMSVRDNMLLSVRPGGSWMRARAAEDRLCGTWSERLSIRSPGLAAPIRHLSGGNQQKVVLARWLLTDPAVLLLDEPTRGIDVGGKEEIHRLVAELADNGLAIVLVSSELQEILGLADRVLVLHAGRLTADLAGDQLTEERIVGAATGAGAHVAA